MPNSRSCNQIIATLKLVPEGHVVSYGQLADYAGLPGRARLVGRCLRQADSSEKLPWHRVVRSDGKLAFDPAHANAKAQRERLLSEGVMVKNNRVSMQTFCWQPDLADILNRLKY